MEERAIGCPSAFFLVYAHTWRTILKHPPVVLLFPTPDRLAVVETKQNCFADKRARQKTWSCAAQPTSPVAKMRSKRRRQMTASTAQALPHSVVYTACIYSTEGRNRFWCPHDVCFSCTGCCRTMSLQTLGDGIILVGTAPYGNYPSCVGCFAQCPKRIIC